MLHDYKKLIAVILTAVVLLAACSTVPVTGRKQLNLIPASTLNSMAFQQYTSFLSNAKLSTDQQSTALVKRVGNNIRQAVEEYMNSQGMGMKLDGYEWEFNLIEDDAANAWAMPGGKVVVYTGILPICQDEEGLAVVMGHEIAHAIAGHGNERMSQGLLTQLGGMAINEALKNKPEETRNLFLTAYGVGANLGVLLPYSRLHESEADHLGLIFMAMAGYNPVSAVDFWQRMAQQGGGAPPEFLSTHPSNQTRIEDLQKAIPEALQYYHPGR